jgi:beta-glucanase (GH16 family)
MFYNLNYMFIANLMVWSIIFLLTSPPGKQPHYKWQLVWSDEFNYTGLPASDKWSYDTGGHGWGNNELQFYTANNSKNASVQNGVLVIRAQQQDTAGSKFTSARLVTRGKASWQYGKIIVRAKLPKGRGTWPAIWMLADKPNMTWPDDGEIDIMEHIGFNPAQIHAAVHTKKYNHIVGTQKTAITQVPNYSEAFHNYSLQWDANRITVSIDEKPFFVMERNKEDYAGWPFDNKMYLLLNIAVGGNWGGQKGVDSEIFPQAMYIDYVRIYQQSNP